MLSGCTTTEPWDHKERFQGEDFWLRRGEVLVKTRHEYNLDIWLQSQKPLGTVQAFKNTGPCPDPAGH